MGLTEIKPGTTMSDVECGSKIQVALIAGIIISIVVVAVALVILFVRHKIGRHAGKGFVLIKQKRLHYKKILIKLFSTMCF